MSHASRLTSEGREAYITRLARIILDVMAKDPATVEEAIIEGRIGLREMPDDSLIELGKDSWNCAPLSKELRRYQRRVHATNTSRRTLCGQRVTSLTYFDDTAVTCEGCLQRQSKNIKDRVSDKMLVSLLPTHKGKLDEQR